MPQCAAYGCKNRGAEEGVSLHKFPIQNPKLLRQWLHNLGRKDYTPTKTSKLCSVHFLPACYKEDPYAKYGIHSPKALRLLKTDAIPTEFVHRQESEVSLSEQTKRPSSVARIQKAEHRAKVAKILFGNPKETEAMPGPASVPVTGTSQIVQSPRIIRKKTKSKALERQAFPQPSSTKQAGLKSPMPRKVISTLKQSKLEEQIPDQPFQWPTQIQSPLRRKTTSTVTKSMLEDPKFRVPSPSTSSKIQASFKSLMPRKSTSTVTRPMLEEQPPDPPIQVLASPGPSPKSRKQLPIISYPAVVYGTPRRTIKDHAYSKIGKFTVGTQTISPPKETTEKSLEPELSSPFKSDSSPEHGSEQLAEYLPESESSTSESEESSGSDHKTKTQNPCQMRKFIIFENNLNELMKFCNKCGSAVVSCENFTRGSMVAYRISCHSGHSYIWQSQPLQQKQPVGNMLIAASILLSGNTYAKMKTFSDVLKLQLFSKSVFNKVQKRNILPIIQEAWENETNNVIEKLKPLGSVVLAGDARCDSPGHNAKYGSYTLMHTDGDDQKGTRKIVSLKLVQVSEVKNSNHMEPEGLDRCLKEILDKQVNISVLATDQHIIVASNMRKNYKEIKHEFDIWHVAKGVKKKLLAGSKTKGCEELATWIQSISNHLWWACATCGQDEQVLREKWLSVLHHITNKHQWSGNQKFHGCSHGQLTSTEKKAICWLKPTSPAFVALKKVVTSTRLLKAIGHLTKFCHTGELEVFHSMLLKYCPKRQHFHYDAMIGRLMLAALEWNSTKRTQKTDKHGKPVTSVVYSKRRKTFVLRNIYEKTTTDYAGGIMNRIFETHRLNVKVKPIERPNIPRNVAPMEKPAKEELEKKYRSRFQ